MKLTDTQIQEITNTLQGTCQNLNDVLQTVVGNEDIYDYDIAIESLREIDDQIACCECCGWWVETHECDSWGVCDDCQDSNDNDD